MKEVINKLLAREVRPGEIVALIALADLKVEGEVEAVLEKLRSCDYAKVIEASRRALWCLRYREREVVKMCVRWCTLVDGELPEAMTLREIAGIFYVQPSAIGQQLSRACGKLRRPAIAQIFTERCQIDLTA